MGNCFVSKPKKDKKKEIEKDSQNSEVAQVYLIQREITDKEEDKETDIKQRNEKKNKKFLQGVIEDQLNENIIRQDKDKTPIDYQMILNALSHHYFFNHLSDQHKAEIVSKMFYCQTYPDQFIFKQGDQASCYFIIAKGQCEIIINDEFKKHLRQGDGFGELALLYGAPRSASVRSNDCELWAIDRTTFRNAVEQLVQKDYEENRKFIDTIKFLDQLNSDQKDAVTGVIITQQFSQGEAIVNEGDLASSYFIIKEGTVSIRKNNKELRKMTKGDSFGEQALYQNSVRGASVIAESEKVMTLALGRETITSILGDKIQVVLHSNLIRWSFEKHEILKKLTQIQLEKIVNRFENKEFKEQEVIYQKNTKCDKLIVVFEGSVQNGNEKLQKGMLFGEQYLKSSNMENLIQNDLIMVQNGRLGVLTFKEFSECIGGELEDVMVKNEHGHEAKYIKKNAEKQKADHLKLEDMIHNFNIFYVGFGQFGSVYLVQNSVDQKFYALKCIQKMSIIEQNLEKHLLQEKRVLEAVQFPFIMQFIRSMKDENNIYFLVEYIKGMELFDVIREIGLLNTYDSQFYVAQMILCMEYLHQRFIVYRDIKPENIMIDTHGYMKLIDMGTAKFLKNKAGKTFTIIGTPHYMAPEIISGKGYSFPVDIWSIGICCFEFMCGGVPFAEDAEDPYEIYEEIIKKAIHYPSFLKDRKVKKLMDQMINKTPEIRMGGNFGALKANSWFDNFNWDKLMEKQLKAPYIPPKDKMIQDGEIQKLLKENKSVIETIKRDPQQKKYQKEKAKNAEWDEEF